MIQNELSLERDRNKKLSIAKQFYMDSLTDSNRTIKRLNEELEKAIFWKHTNVWLGVGLGVVVTLISNRIIGG